MKSSKELQIEEKYHDILKLPGYSNIRDALSVSGVLTVN
jgi:hypothetical protein